LRARCACQPTGRPAQLIGGITGYFRVSAHDRLALLEGSNLFEIVIRSRKPRENKIDHAFRTTLTIAHDNSVNLIASLLLVRIECLGHAAIGPRKLYGERSCIEDRLGRTVAAKGIHRMRGVTHQRHATKAPPR